MPDLLHEALKHPSDRELRERIVYTVLSRLQPPAISQHTARFKGIAEIIKESDPYVNELIARGVIRSVGGTPTNQGGRTIEELMAEGVIKVEPNDYERMGLPFLRAAAEGIASAGLGREKRVLDLGCGIGNFALMTGAAGYPSFGIELHSELVELADANHKKAVARGLIDSDVPVKFVQGDIFDPSAYKKLGVSIKDAGIVYGFFTAELMPRVVRMIADEAQPGTYVLMPHYFGKALGQRVKTPARAPFPVYKVG